MCVGRAFGGSFLLSFPTYLMNLHCAAALAELKVRPFLRPSYTKNSHTPVFALQIVISTLLRRFRFEPAKGQESIDFYHLGGNTVKPKVRGKEGDGVKLPLRVSRV